MAETNSAPVLDVPPLKMTGEQILDAQVRLVVGTMIRGLVATSAVPAHLLMTSIAKQTGEIIAGTITADLSTILTLRMQWKAAFTQAVTKAPIIAPPQAPPTSGNVVEDNMRRLKG